MSTPTTVEAGEHTTDELLDRLEAGERIVVSTTFLGDPHEVTLRFDGETYYCDTPTRLHKHTAADEMRQCMVNNGYATDT
ncbi:hypothetical protein [Halomarina oriensis]|uniref:DUF8001 domain-containing protein n=1 Tax=Halomarina oriensis TaxID=671145 RepID=A0A6B0GLJ3_9EURY|nr:hypothetical protein [Halomarina oriensis]MWG34329.1 hypothetical protein [Halomarina oriensis]